MGIRGMVRSILREINLGRFEKVSVPALADSERLAGRLALVTGGTGGIGLEISRQFIAAGCKVVVAGTRQDTIALALSKISSSSAKGLVLDVRDTVSIPAKIEEAADFFPELAGVDILVNGAGVFFGGRIGRVIEEDWDIVIDVNLKGSFFMAQAVSDHMLKRGLKGNILNISSSSALRPAWGPYEISKWGIKGMTLGMADSLIGRGIVVNSIAPGPTATAMLGKEQSIDLRHAANPSGRLATPEEIASLALSLVCDAGRLIVGDTLYATGGAGTICIDR